MSQPPSIGPGPRFSERAGSAGAPTCPGHGQAPTAERGAPVAAPIHHRRGREPRARASQFLPFPGRAAVRIERQIQTPTQFDAIVRSSRARGRTAASFHRCCSRSCCRMALHGEVRCKLGNDQFYSLPASPTPSIRLTSSTGAARAGRGCGEGPRTIQLQSARDRWSRARARPRSKRRCHRDLW
jgi:hypothetical protein